MSEEKVYTLDDFVEYCKTDYLGKEVGELVLDEPFLLDWRWLRNLSWGLSDDNPLFCDPAYAAKTRWGCQIAHPTIPLNLRYPQSHGALFDRRYIITTLVAGQKLEWFDVFRVGDRITTSLVLKDIFKKTGRSGDLVFLVTEGKLWNQHGDLIAKESGTQINVGHPPGIKRGERMLYEREPYKYSKEEIEKMVECYEAETRRGAKTLYWEDIGVGDKLQTMVRGPLHLGDMILFEVNCQPSNRFQQGPFKLIFDAVKRMPNTRRTNPATNWPYEKSNFEHHDFNLARQRGLPLPFDKGIMRCQLTETLIMNWMGDDGFLRRLEVEERKPTFYGDTNWFSGEVVKKYKVTEGGVEYGAVDIKTEGVNQLGETTTPGSATVYLPSPGHEVQIPIPVGDSK